MEIMSGPKKGGDKVPSRFEVRQKLLALINNSLSREEVEKWADQWGMADDPPDMEDDIWNVLSNMCAAGIMAYPDKDDPYLYGPADFTAWLNELS